MKAQDRIVHVKRKPHDEPVDMGALVKAGFEVLVLLAIPALLALASR